MYQSIMIVIVIITIIPSSYGIEAGIKWVEMIIQSSYLYRVG